MLYIYILYIIIDRSNHKSELFDNIYNVLHQTTCEEGYIAATESAVLQLINGSVCNSVYVVSKVPIFWPQLLRSCVSVHPSVRDFIDERLLIENQCGFQDQHNFVYALLFVTYICFTDYLIVVPEKRSCIPTAIRSA